MKIGMGYDIHRLKEGRPMVIGGVKIKYPKGPEGHSDGDALLHAVCDAILGALGRGDIGEAFPDTDARYKDISSRLLLSTVSGMADAEGFKVGNLDSVVVIEEPKIVTYRNAIACVISDILGIPASSVGVKGKTREKLGEIGEGNAMAAYAVVILIEK